MIFPALLPQNPTKTTMMLSTTRSARLLAQRRPKHLISPLGQAWKSTCPVSDRLDTSKCPIQPNGQSARAWQSTASVHDLPPPDDDLKLTEIPALPFVGSMIQSYSGTPPMDEANVYQTWPELARRHGEFYSIGMPGLGSDLKGTTYIIQDPKEMMKLLRREGIYPTSIVQKQVSE